MAEQDPKSKIYDPPRLIFCYTLLPHFVYLQTPLFPSTLFFTYFHGHSLFLKQLDDVSRSDPTGKETGSECLTLKVIPSRLTQQRQWLQQTSLVGAWGVEETEPLKENLPVTGTGAHVLASPNLSYLCRDFPLAEVRCQLTQQLVRQASVSLKGELDLMAMCDIVLKFKPFTF